MDRQKKIVLGILFFLILGGICSVIWRGIMSQPFQIEEPESISCPWSEGRELKERLERQEMQKRAEIFAQKEKMQQKAAKNKINQTQYQEQRSVNFNSREQDGGVMKKFKKKE